MSSSRSRRAWIRPPSILSTNEVRRLLRRSIHCEKLEDRCLLVSDWSNVLQPLNTSGDDAQVVSPIDALLIINELNVPTIRPASTSVLPPAGTNGVAPPPFVDVNCDNNVTPLDALLIINAINTQVLAPSWRFVHSGPTDATSGVTNDACSPRIKEGSSLVTSLVSDVVIPSGSNALIFEYSTLQFDTASTGRALDAFEAALVDESGRSLVSTLGSGKDSFFNISEGLAAATTANVTLSNNKVALSLVDVLPGIKAKLVLRLVNNDGDTTTAVTIPSIRFEQVQTTSTPNQPTNSNALYPAQPGTSGHQASHLSGASSIPDSSQLAANVLPGLDAIPGRPANGQAQSNTNLKPSGPTQDSSKVQNGPTAPRDPLSPSAVIDNRGTEFWIGFPDNLFEGNNRPQKVLYISGDLATTGVVDIPGLIDPGTSLPFHVEFVVNPGEVTVVELPSADVDDNADNDTDFDVEVERIATIQNKGIHVVTQEPVTIYGLDLAISTSDAFLALPVSTLGTEYINLGYENTFASISHVEGTQFLVVAAEDDTKVTFTPGSYSGSTTASQVAIARPNGSSAFNLGNTDGRDIGTYTTDAAGSFTLTVRPPFDGYSGTFTFEMLDLATAAVPASIGERVTLNFPTGREARVVGFDVVAGQRLYIDTINPNPSPNVAIALVSPSGLQSNLSAQDDFNSVGNLFGALAFAETGKYYVLVVGEQAAAFQFAFQIQDFDAAPMITPGVVLRDTFAPAGRTVIYRYNAAAGETIYYDALDDNRLTGVTIYGPGGQQLDSFTQSDQRPLTFPEDGAYYFIVSSATFGQPSFAFRLLDLDTAANLSFASPTNINVVDGEANVFRFSGVASQNFGLTIQNTPAFRVTLQLLNAAGNNVPLTQNGNQWSATLLTDGSYTLLVGALTVAESGNVTVLPTLNNQPVVIKSGFDTVQSLSIVPGGSATYEFSAPAGTRYIIDGLDTASQNLFLDLRAPDGTRIEAFDEVRDMPRFNPGFLPQSGIYTLTLRGNTATDSGSYDFRVLDLDTFATALQFDTVVTGTRAIGREMNVFAFDAAAGDQLNFDALLGSFAIGIYDPYLNASYAKGFFGAATTIDADGIIRITQTGRHYLVLHGEENTSTSFSFNLQDVASAPTLAFGVTAAGALTGNGSVVYRLNLAAGQRIRVDSLEQDADQVRLSIGNAGGRSLFNDNFSNTDSGPPGVPFIVVPESGEYLIVLSNSLANGADYRFRIDDLGAAPLLAFDADTQIILDPGQSTMVYRVDATAGETIQFDNLGSSGEALIWQLTGPVNQTLGGHNDGLDFSAQVLSSGTHYLTISGRQNSGPLSFRFRATRSPGAVIPLIGVNTVVNLDVGINETKTYTFNAPTGRLTYLNVQKSLFEIPAHTVTLNQGETYLLRDLAGAGFSGAPDLTGSIITSTKPVAVFGGNRATFIPSQFFAADHLVEQLPPTNTWGRDFITMPLQTGSARGDLFRFLAQADNTELTIDGAVVATIDRGEFYQQNIVGAAHVVSDKPILVAQYAYSQNYYRTDPGGSATFNGDPLMMIVPPAEQFLASYTVATPVESSILAAQRFDRNFINIVAPAEDVGVIELDGVPIEANKFTAIGTSGFFGAQIPVPLGAYQLAGPLPFGVFVYGFGSFDSYGYVGGQALSSVAEVSSVVLTPATSARHIGNTLILTARVADSSGAPLKGIRVDFDVAGVNAQRGFGFSDDQGVVQFSYPGVVAGRDVVTAAVGGLLDDSIIDWRADAVAPQVIVAAPLDGSSVAAGTTLVATGQALADFPLATLDLITVNGVPLNNVDAAGNFFVELFVGPGDNDFEFAAIDSNGQVGSTVITITGTQLDTTQIDFTQFTDVSGSFRQSYARSSFNLSTRSFLAETAIENVGQFPANVPLLVGIANISDPLVLVRNADGQTPDGVPYYDFSRLVAGRSLNPLTKTSLLSAEFFNPNQTQFTYDLIFLGKLNDAPVFTSLPPTEAELNREYRYDVQAIDPNSDTVTFELLEAPAGMSIDVTTGLIRWTPAGTDRGLHTIEIRAADNRLGVSSQRFNLSVRPTPTNRAPVFSSLPVAIAEVGKSYSTIAQAVDVDGDALVYRLVSGPVGMTIESDSGVIAWIPTAQQLGSQPVVVQVADASGAAVEQAFTLFVISPADNAPPMIVSTPPTAAKRSGFAYQVIAIDADDEQLTYRLLTSPNGMTIDASGVVQWVPSVSQVEPTSVVIEVRDERGGRHAQSFTLSIFANQDPVISSSPIVTARVDTTYTYQVTSTDPEADPLLYQLLSAPPGMTIGESSGQVLWNVTSHAYVREAVSIAVRDGRGGMATQQFIIDVTGGQTSISNLDPYFVSHPSLVASVGTTWLYTVQARDPENQAITFDLPLAPQGMVIDALTGRVGWTPQAHQVGPQSIVVRVTDAQGGIALHAFEVNVDAANTAPVITSLPPVNASSGNPWEYRLHVQDADGDELTFELESPAAGMTLTALNNVDSAAVLQFTPTVTGALDVVVVVRDGRGGRAEQRFTLQVAASANIPPEITSQPRLMIAAGQPWLYFITTFDQNSDPVALNLAAGPSGMARNTETQLVSWTPNLSQLGTHVVTFNATDNRGGTDSQTFTLTVVPIAQNDAPRIVSMPSAFRASVAEPFAYNLRAEDVDGDPVEWTFVEAPHGASIDRRYGTLRWTPSLAQLGLQRFVISAKDPAGLEALQSFSLNVLGANLGPSLLSRPRSEAVADERYVYGVWAVDPENDPLSFSLINSPLGMTIDATRGIVRWTPTLSQLGIANVAVVATDARGNQATQRFQINVTQVIRNRDPIITSRAVFRARVDATYEYDVEATDPEGSTVTYLLSSAPSGMQIDSASGLITWTPTVAQVGSHLVQVVAQDDAGGQSLQRFAILARVNQAPVINSSAPTSVAIGGQFRYDLQATDPEGDRLNYQLVTGPIGMTIDDLGRVNWTTDINSPTSNPVTLRVTDAFGAMAEQQFVLTVTPDTAPPRVELRLSANLLRLGENSVVVVLASDNVGVVDVKLTMNGQPLILDANHSVTITGSTAGLYELQATARDSAGNVGSANVSLRIFDPADTSGPNIAITSPSPNASVTSLLDIVGTITDDNLLAYRIDYGRADLVDVNQPEAADADYKTLTSGNAVKVDAVLATFDSTMLTNDDYVLRILASDLSGNTTSKLIPLHVEGNLKLGEYNLEFTDLTVPVAGIPITINRTYNTRNANESGDFGFGWTLSIQDAQIRETIPVNPLEADGLTFAATPFREGTRVYLTNAEGRRVGFTFQPTPQFSLFGGGSFLPRFVPDVGVYDTLDVGSVPLRKIGNEFYSGFFGEPFNPAAYRLTTKDGTTYEYGQFSGLANVYNRAGNRLEFRPDGIFSSAGPSVQFIRDPQGRISKIIDPAGNVLSYEYNAANELIQFTDQAGLTRDYSYFTNPKHFLRTIVDPNGQQIFVAQFDSAGRLTSSTNAIGARLTNTFDVANLKEITTDPLGNVTTVQFDHRGNIAQVQRPGGGVIAMEYDSQDNLIKATDEAGNVVTQAFDAQGNLIAITDPLGKSYTSTFNSAGQVTSTTDPLGRSSHFVYDDTGNLIRFVNAVGQVSTSAYDDQGRLVSTTDGRGLNKRFTYTTGARASSVVFAGATSSSNILPASTPTSKQYEYNQLGQLIRETDENGHVTHYGYDAAGRPVSVTDPTGARYSYFYSGDRMVEGLDPLGRATRAEYDNLGRRVRTIDALGGVSSVTYDANNQIIAATDQLGRITTYRYRSDSRMESETDVLGNVTRYEYDAVGHRTAIVDALGRRWTYGYDALGRLLSETDPLGAVTRYSYDDVGNRISTTDANGNTTRYVFDDLNRLVRQIDALGNSYAIEYDRNGNPVKLTDPTGGVSTFEYDDKDRLVKATDAAGFVRQQTFDAYGNRLSVTDESGNTTELFYDAANRGVRTRDSSGNETTRVFDAFGNTIRVTNQLGQATSFEVDALNRVKSIATADGRISRKRYDAVGNQTQFTDPLGNTTRFEYDALNRLAKRIDPLNNASTMSYDEVGNLISEVDRNGREIRYTYDAARQLTKEEWFTDSVLVESIELTYDAFGSLLTAVDPRSSLTFTYDALNRLKTQDNLGTSNVPRMSWTAAYDARGNLERVTDSSNTIYSRTLDNRNRTTTSSLNGGGVDPVRADFAYDAAGRRTSVTRFADLAGVQKTGSSEWLYNARGQLTDLTHFNALDAVLVDFDYEYDATSQLVEESGTSGAVQYNYDDAGQLIGVDRATAADESYAYDANGNRQHTDTLIGPNNQLLRDSQFRYAYDNEGNLVSKTEISTSAVTQFTYDHRNRLTRVEVRSSSGTVSSQTNYVYDALDRRILVDNNGTEVATVYVGSAVWADFDASGNVLARYLPGEGTDELLARYRPGEGSSWYLADRLGSIRNLIDSTGAIVDTIAYDSFGNLLNETNPSRGDRFRFTGREFDSTTGLYYNRARYYDPRTGEFISEDPLVFGGGDANLQRYAGNDPINATDPTGTQAISESGGLSAFVSVYADFALTYGADEPFTFRIGCKAGACGISGVTDPSTKLKVGFAVPGSDGRLKATVQLGTKESSATLSSNLGPLTGSVDTKGKVELKLSKKIKDIDFSASTDGTKVKGKVEGPGPFSPSFGTESATLPSIPSLPRQGEFDFLVQSTATAPHLVIAADIAIYVGVAQQLELIARVATADDMETVVTVHYEQATEAPSPNAAVKAVGFAQLPLGTPGSGPGSNGPGGRSDRLTPGSSSNNNPGDGDGDTNGGGPSGSPTGPGELGDGSVASIGEFVWYDVNKNGIQDASESGVSGVLVHLYSPGANGLPYDLDDILLRSIRTDALGYYLFAALQPGAYYIQFDITTLPAGYVITTPNVGTDERDSDASQQGRDSLTNLEAGEVDLTHDLGIKLA